MRENRLHGSEGGVAMSHPDPYQGRDLRRELIGLLRQARAKRRLRSRGEDRRGKIADMISLHLRPPEIEDRLIPGHPKCRH